MFESFNNFYFKVINHFVKSALKYLKIIHSNIHMNIFLVINLN